MGLQLGYGAVMQQPVPLSSWPACSPTLTGLSALPQRFSSADVAAEAACLRQRCLGMRVANVYDINPKVSGRRWGW